MTSWRAHVVALMVTLFYAAPGWCCSVCFDANAEVRWSFLITTALLTFLPLIMLGSFLYWLRRRALQVRAIEAAAAAV